MKTKKAVPPSSSQKLLGVIFDIQETTISLAPCLSRAERLQDQLRNILRCDPVRPEDAQKLCGKLVFLRTISFGQIGKSLLLPLYSRAQASDHSSVTSMVDWTASKTLSQLLLEMPPRQMPMTFDHTCSSLYKDTFSQLGDNKLKPTDDTVPRSWQPSSALWIQNGWGFALCTGSLVLAARPLQQASSIHLCLCLGIDGAVDRHHESSSTYCPGL